MNCSVKLVCFATFALSLTACHAPPKIATPEERFESANSMLTELLAAPDIGCPNAELDYVETESDEINVYDLYSVKGCEGIEVFVIHTIAANGAALRISAYPSPSPEDFLEVGVEQLRKTAEFELGCEALEFSAINLLTSHDRRQFLAELGVTGCEQRKTYKVGCQTTGYAGKSFEITCATSQK